MRVILRDEHPGKWNEGVAVYLCTVRIIENGEESDEFITGIRVPGTPTMGMFDEHEAPLQVLRKRDNQWWLTMSNMGVLSTEQVRDLLAKGTLTFSHQWDDGAESTRWELSLQ